MITNRLYVIRPGQGIPDDDLQVGENLVKEDEGVASDFFVRFHHETMASVNKVGAWKGLTI